MSEGKADRNPADDHGIKFYSAEVEICEFAQFARKCFWACKFEGKNRKVTYE